MNCHVSQRGFNKPILVVDISNGGFNCSHWGLTDLYEEYYPEELENYRKMVEQIPTDSSWDRVGVNRFIASQTYNSIRPIVDDIELCEWLTIDEDEYYRD